MAPALEHVYQTGGPPKKKTTQEIGQQQQQESSTGIHEEIMSRAQTKNQKTNKDQLLRPTCARDACADVLPSGAVAPAAQRAERLVERNRCDADKKKKKNIYEGVWCVEQEETKNEKNKNKKIEPKPVRNGGNYTGSDGFENSPNDNPQARFDPPPHSDSETPPDLATCSVST